MLAVTKLSIQKKRKKYVVRTTLKHTTMRLMSS